MLDPLEAAMTGVFTLGFLSAYCTIVFGKYFIALYKKWF